MSIKSIGSVTVSFGLVNVPMHVLSAKEPEAKKVSFNMLHDTCGSRLRQQYTCEKEGGVVGREATVKGYEFAKGQYVRFNENEIKAIQEPASPIMPIQEFVPAASVDPSYFSSVSYLSPDKGADNAYWLLYHTMKAKAVYGVAQYASRGSQKLVVLRAGDGAILMHELLYAEELRPISQTELVPMVSKPEELAMAAMLVQNLVVDAFQPEKYEDESRARAMEMIERKVKDGGELVVLETKAKHEMTDLMAALRASLAESDAKPAKPATKLKLVADKPKRAAAK